jgi:hypothetical protein
MGAEQLSIEMDIPRHLSVRKDVKYLFIVQCIRLHYTVLLQTWVFCLVLSSAGQHITRAQKYSVARNWPRMRSAYSSANKHFPTSNTMQMHKSIHIIILLRILQQETVLFITELRLKVCMGVACSQRLYGAYGVFLLCCEFNSICRQLIFLL